MTSSGIPAVFDPTPFLSDFREESGELLGALDALLLQIDATPDWLDAIREMFIAVHTIKGGASMLRLSEVAELAHALEDVLARLQKDSQPPDRPTVDLLFLAVDVIRELTEQPLPGDGEPGERATALAATLRDHATKPGLRSDEGLRTEDSGLSDHPLSPSSVLLVEDSPTVRMLVTMLLSKFGVRVEALADGREALDKAMAQPYSLVITSMETRGMRGLELAAALRLSTTCRDVPIIVMSSDDDPEARKRAFGAGAQAFVRKGSFDRWRLLETVRELLPAGALAPVSRPA